MSSAAGASIVDRLAPRRTSSAVDVDAGRRERHLRGAGRRRRATGRRSRVSGSCVGVAARGGPVRRAGRGGVDGDAGSGRSTRRRRLLADVVDARARPSRRSRRWPAGPSGRPCRRSSSPSGDVWSVGSIATNLPGASHAGELHVDDAVDAGASRCCALAQLRHRHRHRHRGLVARRTSTSPSALELRPCPPWSSSCGAGLAFMAASYVAAHDVVLGQRLVGRRSTSARASALARPRRRRSRRRSRRGRATQPAASATASERATGVDRDVMFPPICPESVPA